MIASMLIAALIARPTASESPFNSSIGIAANAALICAPSTLPSDWRRLPRGDVQIAKAEPAMLTTADERRPAQPVDDRNGIAKTVQRVPSKDGVFIDKRIHALPVLFEPLRRHVERVGEGGHSIGSEQRGSQVRQQPKILARLQCLESQCLYLSPIRWPILRVSPGFRVQR